MTPLEGMLSSALVAVVVLMVYISRVSYAQGIWDGAFNQFLPKVQKEMRFYDPWRAEQILGPED